MEWKESTCYICGDTFWERERDNFGMCKTCEEEELNADGEYDWYYGTEVDECSQ